MVLRMNFFLLVCISLVALAGCYTTPVRHLSADIALLKVGSSTEEEVLIFLGEPDEKRDAGTGVVKWLYHDKKMSLLEKAPLIGKRIGSPEYQQVAVTLTNNIVTDIAYSSSDADELGWTDDYPWQEKKE